MHIPYIPPPFRSTTFSENAALAKRMERTFGCFGFCKTLSSTFMRVTMHTFVSASKFLSRRISTAFSSGSFGASGCACVWSWLDINMDELLLLVLAGVISGAPSLRINNARPPWVNPMLFNFVLDHFDWGTMVCRYRIVAFSMETPVNSDCIDSMISARVDLGVHRPGTSLRFPFSAACSTSLISCDMFVLSNGDLDVIVMLLWGLWDQSHLWFPCFRCSSFLYGSSVLLSFHATVASIVEKKIEKCLQGLPIQ